ncbi:YidC/Oxa1 family membrane protein insertase [Teredinibacter turnerae]|uniref:YidC/Oxa1 family membrane protein insertase n=1 Tax=Teredinibacter turnerae TaxID=2426 RepID=UPI0003FF37AB|nr:membrane protein insertase YidC [Teredinibacter turnerae]
MEIWDIWTSFIASGIDFLSMYFGVSEALAIIIFTLLARIMLMPISLKSAYIMHKNKLAIERVKPEIERLRDIYSERPGELAKRTMAIYKEHGIKFLDKTSVINIGSQGILGLGIFQALRDMVFSSKFMWIADIAKPDVILAIIVGVFTLISMQMMPGAVEQQNLLIFLIPAIVSMFVLVSFPSALGLYWATSNIVTILQTLALRLIILKENQMPGRA